MTTIVPVYTPKHLHDQTATHRAADIPQPRVRHSNETSRYFGPPRETPPPATRRNIALDSLHEFLRGLTWSAGILFGFAVAVQIITYVIDR